jgi:hypothetical protein
VPKSAKKGRIGSSRATARGRAWQWWKEEAEDEEKKARAERDAGDFNE